MGNIPSGERFLDASGTFTAIEGNTNAAGEREGGAVLRKRRKVELVRSAVKFY